MNALSRFSAIMNPQLKLHYDSFTNNEVHMRLLVFQCGVEPFRCTGVGDGKLTCSGELRAAVLTSGRRSASASKSWPSSRGWCHLPRRLPRRHHRPPPPESPIMPPPAPPSPSPPTFADLRADYESSAPQTAGSVASFASPSGLSAPGVSMLPRRNPRRQWSPNS